MSWYRDYKLIKDGEGYIVEIYINPDDTEFSSEFFDDIRENVLTLDEHVKKFVQDNLKDIKVNAIKLFVGALLVGSLPLSHGIRASAETTTSPAITTSTTTTTSTTGTTSTAPTFTISPLSGTGTVTASSLNVRTGPDSSYSAFTKIYLGQQFPVIGQSGSWYQIELTDGSIGFVSSTYLTLATTSTAPTYTVSLLNTTGTVTSTSLNVRTGPGTTYLAISKLLSGSQTHVIGQSGDWYQVQLADGRTGFVNSTYLRLEVPTTQQKIDLTISVAKSLIGTPYVWGGESLAEGGFDCSGFTQYVFKQAGYTLNRVSVDQATQGTPVARTDLKPGDLVFFDLAGDGRISHVGIYIGDGKMIHSPKTGDYVKITDVTTSFWQTHFVTARRIIQ